MLLHKQTVCRICIPFEHLDFSVHIHSGVEHYYKRILYLGFILSLEPLCGPSLAPWSYRTQQRLASDEKKVSIFQSDTVIVPAH